MSADELDQPGAEVIQMQSVDTAARSSTNASLIYVTSSEPICEGVFNLHAARVPDS
jgi:hypothetical protein